MAALSKLRGRRCMSLAGPQPPRHPTSALPNPVGPRCAAWQGHGAHALQRGAAPSAGIRRSSAPRRQPGRSRPGVPAHWPAGAPRLRARKSLDPGWPGGDRARRQSCATAVAGQHHGTRGRSRRSTTARFRHIWCCRTRRGPVLRCNTCVTCPTRWQPPSGSA